MRVELQNAWVLHTRPYRDTSLIVDLFTRDSGRVSVIAKGVRAVKSSRSQKNNQRQRLNPFIPLLVSYQGRHELKTLTGVETHGYAAFLQGRMLFSALYLNELLIRLLPAMDAHPEVFDRYHKVLSELGQCEQHDSVDENALLECILRRFELSLLQDLGYGINFDSDCDTGEAIQKENHYQYNPERGFSRVSGVGIAGIDLQALGMDSLGSAGTRRVAKYITRSALQLLLGAKPLKSRELFREVKK